MDGAQLVLVVSALVIDVLALAAIVQQESRSSVGRRIARPGWG